MTDKKLKTFRKLALTFFKLEAQRGHKKWSVAELARLSDVSRPTIYRYLGSSKDDIVRSCLRHFTSEFYGLAAVETTDLTKNLSAARKVLEKYHDAVVFYQKWRARKGWICQEFVDIERAYQKKLQRQIPGLSDKGARVFHAIFHGLVTAPFLTPESVAEAVKYLADHTEICEIT